MQVYERENLVSELRGGAPTFVQYGDLTIETICQIGLVNDLNIVEPNGYYGFV